MSTVTCRGSQSCRTGARLLTLSPDTMSASPPTSAEVASCRSRVGSASLRLDTRSPFGLRASLAIWDAGHVPLHLPAYMTGSVTNEAGPAVAHYARVYDRYAPAPKRVTVNVERPRRQGTGSFSTIG